MGEAVTPLALRGEHPLRGQARLERGAAGAPWGTRGQVFRTWPSHCSAEGALLGAVSARVGAGAQDRLPSRRTESMSENHMLPCRHPMLTSGGLSLPELLHPGSGWERGSAGCAAPVRWVRCSCAVGCAAAAAAGHFQAAQSGADRKASSEALSNGSGCLREPSQGVSKAV